MSQFDFYQGTFVIILTLIIMGTLLGFTHRPKWDLRETLLLLGSAINYILDTLWWWYDWHFAFTDHYFFFNGHRYQLTIFFILSGLLFFLLILKRWKKQQ